MSDKGIQPSKYSELRSIYKYYIDSYIALFQLKTANEEDLNSIFQMIKKNLIDSKIFAPQTIARDILNMIPFNNRYTKSYLALAKFICDEYHVTEVKNIQNSFNYLFYKEYGINLNKSLDISQNQYVNLDINENNAICKAIIDNNKEKFITLMGEEGFDENQKHMSELYPEYYKGLSLLELCCYHGAADCFKLLITKFNSEITQRCLELSVLGGNQEIMSECLKYQKPNKECMKYAIISHNIDFVTFLMNEYNMEIILSDCASFNNLDAFLVYFDQTNEIDNCFVYSGIFNIPSLHCI
ncbi:hypothetical protein TVAG_343220 [Trichomonas vaginalis G3]|uniref:DUF3447 domain-containing protein n=1 Tax=Trichomonas vaginalis (strain ATCC PRA-98 / G3) TaxID=412133 RepID=A2E1C6_TRIV3|nr:hypothetical protein TVAG_343220 [Trichomonas vaginalis G3]|eukprot:XP_001325716.1 hypothetical protein [Trichomonas vaginalis G3]